MKSKLTQKLEAAAADAERLALSPEALTKLLRKERLTTEQICERLNVGKDNLLRVLRAMQDTGATLYMVGDKWGIEPQPPVGDKRHVYTSRPDGTYLFGFASDAHLCSKHARLDVLNDLYDRFAALGVDRVLNAGNWIDGERRFNRYDLLVSGFDAQLEYLVDNFPQRPGIATYAISGDDHEGWYGADLGVDVGRRAQDEFRRAGREDWHDLGFMESFVDLTHTETGVTAELLIIHPGGGTAYALSYRPQKIVEGLTSGEKPAVLLIGHFHKLSYNIIRNVHVIQCGTSQDQTTFMRKKGIDAHVGGGVCRLEQDGATGAIVGCQVEVFYYFNRGYYNDRWSQGRNIKHADRGVRQGGAA